MNAVRRWLSGFGARRRYFVASDAWTAAADELGRSVDAYGRMFALLNMAECELTMAQNAHGFYGASKRDRDGRTLADSCELAGRLIGLVAGTEGVVAGFVEPCLIADPAGIVDTEAYAVLAALSATADPTVRGALTLSLYAAVVDSVGGQAAEALAAVAARYYALAGMSEQDITARIWPTRGEQ